MGLSFTDSERSLDRQTRSKGVKKFQTTKIEQRQNSRQGQCSPDKVFTPARIKRAFTPLLTISFT